MRYEPLVNITIHDTLKYELLRHLFIVTIKSQTILMNITVLLVIIVLILHFKYKLEFYDSVTPE